MVRSVPRLFVSLVLGDFSSRVNRGLHDGLAGRRPVLADLDNFDDVMREMAPTLRLPGTGSNVPRSWTTLHPDVDFIAMPRSSRNWPSRHGLSTSAGGGADENVEQFAPSRRRIPEQSGRSLAGDGGGQRTSAVIHRKGYLPDTYRLLSR